MRSKHNLVGSLADESQASDKYRRILEAGVKVFARKGFHNARVNEIAREAGVADGTIYIYFKNKDDILIKIFEESLALIIARLKTELSRQTDAVAKVKLFIKMHLDLMKEDQALGEVFQVELRQSNKFMKEYLPQRYYDYLDVIAEILREGQKAGLFRPEISPDIFKRALFGALDEISLFWILRNREQGYLENSREQLADIFLRGIARG